MRILWSSRSTFFKTCIFLDQQTSCLFVRFFCVMMMQGNDQAGNGVAKHDLGIPGKVKMAGSFRWTKFCFFISFSPTRRHWHYPPFRQQCHHHYQQHQHHRQPHQYRLITEYTKFVFNENIPPEGLEALEDKAIATWGDFIKITNRLDDMNHCQLLINLLSISALLLWWPKSLSLICK